MIFKQATQRGQTLIEILLATALFLMGVIVSGILVLNAVLAQSDNLTRTEAVFLAEEGIEAVRSIRDSDFDSLISGTYGITRNNGVYELIPAFDSVGQFTRTIVISDIDVDTREISSTVSWQLLSGLTREITRSTQITDWRQTHGEAGDISILNSTTLLSGSLNEIVNGIFVSNISSKSVRLDDMIVSWQNTSLLREIVIDGSTVFLSGGSASGLVLDITNTIMQKQVTDETILIFSDAMDNTDILVTLLMRDGSTHHGQFETVDESTLPEADLLVIDTSQASYQQGGRRLRDIFLTNIGTSRTITLSRMIPVWGTSAILSDIQMDSISVWTGSAVSGTDIDIADTAISPGSTVTITRMQFNTSVAGSTFDISFIMGDGSSVSSGSFQP
jgi:Tfp pilus assembly protein PilV